MYRIAGLLALVLSGTLEAYAQPAIVEFGPAVSQQFRRPRGLFAARSVMTQAEYGARNTLPKGNSGPASLPQAHADPDVIASFFGDRTILTHSQQHGTQIEYISRSGETSLWYPGDDMILRGAFVVLWEKGAAEIDDPQDGRYRGQINLNYVCFRYAANSYNPTTGHRGGGFECGTYASQRARLKETRKGDVFGLARRDAAPFPLGREAQSIAALQKRVGAVRP
ncbi:hypothetical protein LJR009_001153 [Bosea sp. LjRoot9]